jgi:RNA polymerase sigma factor (TIGR02999 family)
MRQILIERARARDAQKRGGGQPRITFDEQLPARVDGPSLDVIAIDAALDRLAAMDADQARIVELRYFGGLSEQEVADVLGLSRATVTRDWQTARAWLYRRITKGKRASS